MDIRQSTDGWHPTACILCYVNCGIEVMTAGRDLVRVRGDRAHPSTHGYLCQKAQRLNFYQNHVDRLTTPLRRRTDGSFAAIDWDTALGEIAQRLNHLRSKYGGKAFAFYGGGGQGNHLGGAYGVSLLRAMGSSNYYSALSQEKTGDFWVNGFLFGAQNVHTVEDVEHCDLLVVIGCNPWLAHGFRNARNLVNEIKSDPDGALRIHSDDIAALGAVNGGWLAVETRTGRIVVRVEADDSLRRGVVALPHGYGQSYPQGEGRAVVGPRINFLTTSDDCDPIAATPHHKNVRVRLVPLDPASAAAAEANAARALAVAAA